MLSRLSRRLSGKECACNAGEAGGKIRPQVGKLPWGKERQPTPVFSPRKSHEQRSLVGYS